MQSRFLKYGKQLSKSTVGGETGKLEEHPVTSLSVSVLLKKENGALRGTEDEMGMNR